MVVVNPSLGKVASAVFVLALCVVLTVGVAAGSTPKDVVRCDRVSMPQGNDSARGSSGHPYRTAQRLIDALRPGMTGCLGGTFTENVKFVNGGQPGKRVTLRALPGAGATICGYLAIADSASYVTISHLAINGSCSPQNALQVFGDFFTFQNGVINGGHSAWGQSCVFIGHPDYGVAVHATIDHNRIHDCGTSGYAHGFYVDDARDSVITNNLIYRNSGFGIQLYPNAQHSLIAGNVIDGNGTGNIIFGAEDSAPSSDNIVRYNVLSSPSGGYNLMESWAGPVGTGNVAERNCLWPKSQTVGTSHGGLLAQKNVLADPGFLNRSIGDFRLRPGSPCEAARLRER